MTALRPCPTPASPIGWTWHGEAPDTHGAKSRRERSFVIAALRACFAAAIVAAGAGAIGFLIFVASLDRYERAPPMRADAIVVLTGGAERIADGIDLLAQGFGNRLLISGVNERTSRDEIARLNPGQRKLFECCVDLDYRARNTIGNAIETRRWLQDHGFRSLIVVTSNYHMPRTLVELEHALPQTRVVPYAVVSDQVRHLPWWRDYGTFRLLAVEYVKLLVGWARTFVETDPERSRAARMLGGGEPVKLVMRSTLH